MDTFFRPEDYLLYLQLTVEFKEKCGVDIWAYCLMPNHVHLVLVPQDKDSLARFFGHVHRQYTRRINLREGWKGHLWQERFHSFVMDEAYLLATVRYTELNPVRARLCDHAWEWPWSSVHAHLTQQDDSVVSVSPMLQRVSDWPNYIASQASEAELESIRAHGRTGRPAGGADFLALLQSLTGRDLARGKPGRKTYNQ